MRSRLLALIASGFAVCGVMLAAEALHDTAGKNGRIAFMRAATPDGRTARSSRATRKASSRAA